MAPAHLTGRGATMYLSLCLLMTLLVACAATANPTVDHALLPLDEVMQLSETGDIKVDTHPDHAGANGAVGTAMRSANRRSVAEQSAFFTDDQKKALLTAGFNADWIKTATPRVDNGQTPTDLPIRICPERRGTEIRRNKADNGVKCYRGDIVKFDDLFLFEYVPAGYHGLEWSYYYAISAAYLPNTGYANGTVSQSNTAFNANGDPAQFGVPTGSPASFSLISMYLTAAWRDNLEVTFTTDTGFVRHVTVSTTAPTLLQFGPKFKDIRTVYVTASGGTLHDGLGGDGTHYAMDNVEIIVK